MPSRGISADGEHWEPARGKFLIPVDRLSRKIATEFREALNKEAPEVSAAVPAAAWRREWVSFCKHYGHGNDAVLQYLSRYVFRTAISNARIIAMDQSHVTFRWKDRNADAWRTLRLPGVEFLRRFLQHVLPGGFHKSRYYGLWHPSKRDLASRACLLLILQKPSDESGPISIADLLNLLRTQSTDDEDPGAVDNDDDADDNRNRPLCPHCGSDRTTLIDQRHSPART